jgi:hypothetical protein
MFSSQYTLPQQIVPEGLLSGYSYRTHINGAPFFLLTRE